MDKNEILKFIKVIPENIDFSEIVEQLTSQPGVSQTTLAGFVNSSKSAIGRIKKGQDPKFQTGLKLLVVYTVLCPINNDEKGKDNA